MSSEINTHLKFLSYLHEWCVDLKLQWEHKLGDMRKPRDPPNCEATITDIA